MNNVFVMIADCLRQDYAARHFAWLYQQAQAFENCWTTAGSTCPAVFSLLTGEMPHDHGCVAPGFRPISNTLVEMAEEAGYNVLFVTENPFTRWAGVYFQAFMEIRGNFIEPSIGFKYIAEHLPKEPWMVVYHNMRSHHPYFRHPLDLSGTPIDPYVVNKTGKCTEWEADQLRTAYEASVFILAAEMRSFCAELPGEPVVVLTADHGEAFFEHGFVAHVPYQLWPETLHVPLVVSDGISAESVSMPVSTTLLPDIVMAAMNGGRITPVEKLVVAEDYQGASPVKIVRQGNYVASVNNGEFYYDLSRDKSMRHPLKETDELADRFKDWIKPSKITGHPAAIDDEELVIDRLRQLGYIE